MRRILLVEDDKLLSKTLKATFEDANYSVAIANDSDEVFKVLSESEIDMIYLDLILAGSMDGYEILHTIKLPDSNYKEIPVVILSNLGQMIEIDRAMELGASDYVIKANIDLDQIIELTKKKIGTP